MDLQKVLADAQARADANGDGKLNIADVQALADQYGLDANVVGNLRSKADTNGDGKVDLEDLKSGVGSVGQVADGLGQQVSNTVNDLKEKFFGGK